MKTIKTAPTIKPLAPCFECEHGVLEHMTEDYRTTIKDHGEIIIANVPMERCNCCGDTVIADAGNRLIDTHLDKITNAITPEEVQYFLSKYNLTQKSASKITGYGEKNISRWLSGKMRPSDSVSNFLRLLIADEEAFERLKVKNWTAELPASYPEEKRQPDEEEKSILKLIDYPKLVSLDVVSGTRSPLEKRTLICQYFRCSTLQNLKKNMEAQNYLSAAYKDTAQKSNLVSAGIWMKLGEKAAQKIKVSPYDRIKLEHAVNELRELTQHPLDKIMPDVQKVLADAGVALVFVPIMKHSALRGCTRLLTPSKAMIIHSLKYRSLSQFWIILFHEIAHLLLHIKSPEDVFAEYADQSSEKKELQADEWAHDKLASVDKLLEFSNRYPEFKNWQIAQFANEIKIHPAIVAEIFNKREKREVIKYSRLQMDDLYPNISSAQADQLWSSSDFN